MLAPLSHRLTHILSLSLSRTHTYTLAYTCAPLTLVRADTARLLLRGDPRRVGLSA